MVLGEELGWGLGQLDSGSHSSARSVVTKFGFFSNNLFVLSHKVFSAWPYSDP